MTEYYLATDGDDANSGTRDQPFGSLQTLMDVLSAGDVGYARGGTYYPTGYADGAEQQGSSGSPIRLEAYPGESVTFDFGNGTYGGVRLWKCAWWELRGFTVVNAPSYGIYTFGGTSDTLVEDVRVDRSGGDSNTSGVGINVYNSPRTTLRNCEVSNSYDPASGGGNADGIAMEACPGSVVEGCVSHGNSDDGIDFWLQEDAVVRDCVAYDNGWAGDGNGFKLGGGGTSGGHTVTNCVAYQNRKRGFHFNEANVPITLYNNTAWDNPENYYFAKYAHVLRNNLSDAGDANIGSVVDDAANSWNLGITDAGFASTDPSSSDFLRLTSDSPAVDAGVDVGLPYAGDAPDLGAFETDGTTRTTSNVNPVLKVATADGSGGVAFTQGTANYFDGTAWRTPTVKYYDGNTFMTVAEGSTATSDPTLVDGFERGDLTPYSGDRSSFTVTTERAAEGSNALKSTGGKSAWRTIYSTDGLPAYVPHGSTFQARVFLTDASDCAILRFGMRDSNNWIGAGYNGNNGGIQISSADAGSWSELGSGSMSPALGEWMTWVVEWGVVDTDQVAITCYDAAGNEVGSGSTATSVHQDNAGVGFEYTFQYGGTGPVYFDDLRLV